MTHKLNCIIRHCIWQITNRLALSEIFFEHEANQFEQSMIRWHNGNHKIKEMTEKSIRSLLRKIS